MHIFCKILIIITLNKTFRNTPHTVPGIAQQCNNPNNPNNESMTAMKQ